MKVLTIISKLEMGGIEKTLLSCLPYLISHGVQISILCDIGGKLQPEFERLGVRIIDFAGLKKPFLDAFKLKQLLKSEKFDIVHSRYGHTSGVFARVCYDLNIPILISVHNEKAMFRNNWERKPILGKLRHVYLNFHKKLTYKYANCIIGHSNANLNYYKDIPKKYDSKIRVLYNGVDFSKFENYPSLSLDKQNKLDEIVDGAKKVFIHIGKFKEQKNHSFLIDIFSRLNPKENKYILILLGEGPLKSEIKYKVDTLGLKDQVYFAGMETNIAPYLYKSDIFIFPSLYEGFGNVLIEAQYAKVAIAASNILPHYEASFSDYHKFFFDPSNLEDSLDKIKQLLATDLVDTINTAYKFSAEFSIENMAGNLLKIYNEYIKRCS